MQNLRFGPAIVFAAILAGTGIGPGTSTIRATTFDEVFAARPNAAVPYKDLKATWKRAETVFSRGTFGWGFLDDSIPSVTLNAMADGSGTNVLMRTYYYQGMQRRDDIIGRIAVIIRPDLHERIYLDLQNKRYSTMPMQNESRSTYVDASRHRPVIYTERRKQLSNETLAGIALTVLGVYSEIISPNISRPLARQSSVVYIDPKRAEPQRDLRSTFDDITTFLRPPASANDALRVMESGAPLPTGFRMYQVSHVEYSVPQRHRAVVSILRSLPKEMVVPVSLFNVPPGFKRTWWPPWQI
ncbi:MAG TPA: hypothetical protein VFA29_10340 [Candidatus Baltobacteraceae bacterium]|nr:hypothetical protein [Candidatus Baltobacteraceae bacterium]